MKFFSYILFAALMLLSLSGAVRAAQIEVPIPGGSVFLPVSHASPSGQLAEPEDPDDAGFRPPTIFAAPLPTGSGARALGQAGAFTAVADDATAASWNPAGLTQLEYAEMSVVYRFSSQEDRHHSSDSDLLADSDRYSNSELNYASAVYPFLLNGHNAVFSMNFQEAYDFTQSFTARFQGETEQDISSVVEQDYYKNSTTNYNFTDLTLSVNTRTSTHAESQIDQLLKSSLLSEISFFQEGTIDALSPAFAVDLTPKMSVGVAMNVYVDGSARGNPIRSSLITDYSGSSESYAEIIETLTSTSLVDVTGTQIYGGLDPREESFTNDTQSTQYSDTYVYTNEGSYYVEGSYREVNQTDQFYGFNATLGALWAASDRLTLGASVDLPWTGRGKQEKNIQHQITTFSTNGVQLAQNSYQISQQRDVEYTFPLYWALGALWRWNDRLYSSMDVSRTHWSDYTYKADGEERINPISGESQSVSGIDDCWSVRLGSEYLCVLSWTEIPLRGGLFWEQRPAVGSPDEYWGVTLGSGISLGEEPGRLILDIAYSFERGEGVMGSLLPGQGMTSDVTRHQLFVSAIWHF